VLSGGQKPDLKYYVSTHNGFSSAEQAQRIEETVSHSQMPFVCQVMMILMVALIDVDGTRKLEQWQMRTTKRLRLSFNVASCGAV